MASPDTLLRLSGRLSEDCDAFRFSAPVTHVYNPLTYAKAPHRTYLKRFGAGTGRVLLLGMNPGPWGMAQTGVPFGDVAMVRDWIGIEGKVAAPKTEHPKRPVQGFACPRSEVSGTRLWGWARDRFGTADAFFERFFVWNYCPLAFMEESGRNRTPDKLPAEERDPLFARCDAALEEFVDALQPRLIVGVGKFAEKRAQTAVGDAGVPIGAMLHPSPASPAANKNWAKAADAALTQLGLEL